MRDPIRFIDYDDLDLKLKMELLFIFKQTKKILLAL